MLEDPVGVAGLVAREVRSTTRDGVPTKTAVARRTYATDRADLWQALTDPERIPRWFLPVAGDLVVGGRYQTQGNAGGVVEHCVAPSTFSVTWEFGATISWLTVSLTLADGGTVLELVHEAPVDPVMWDQFGPGAVGVGWDLAMIGLHLHLGGGAAVDPAEGAAFPTTPGGRLFVERAATGWAEAAIADGDPAEAARAAGAATTAFYTGEPQEG